MTDRKEHTPPPALGPGRGVRVEQSVTVHRTAAELFRLWRDLSTMGHVFRHVERVECVSSHRSHWVVKGPVGTTMEWDAEVINEVENRLIGWQSLPGADVDCRGYRVGLGVDLPQRPFERRHRPEGAPQTHRNVTPKS